MGVVLKFQHFLHILFYLKKNIFLTCQRPKSDPIFPDLYKIFKTFLSSCMPDCLNLLGPVGPESRSDFF
jgi:hypothetical protein